MDRRDFLKAAAFAGMAVSSPAMIMRGVGRAAEPQGVSGPLVVFVQAVGGWDPTSLCDPKGRENEEELDPMNWYFQDDILTAGNISYPTAYRTPAGQIIAETGNHAFFSKWYDKLMVLNGVDTSTNGHDSGRRFTASGKLQEGYPALGALVAAINAAQAPMSFVTNGGYDYTAGLVAPTRVGNTTAMTQLAFPNRINPADAESTYHTNETWERIQKYRKDRNDTVMAGKELPLRKRTRARLFDSRVGTNQLKQLSEYLPELDNTNNPLRRQAQLAIAAYKAGIAASANLATGGFDTHGDHDNRQFNALRRFTEGVDFLMDEAERQGVADDIVVVMTSDFGRTPGYNMNNGKDHWSITSMMLMGKGIPGNTVIGATTHGHVPHTVNPGTLELDPTGIRLTPEHVHVALRKLTGIYGHEIEQLFPIAAEDLPFFD